MECHACRASWQAIEEQERYVRAVGEGFSIKVDEVIKAALNHSYH